MLRESLFYAKILLFGEYGIIQDSMGLSIPYGDFKGTLKFPSNPSDKENYSNGELKKFYSFLKNDNELASSFNLMLMEADIKDGLVFDSTIPQGFGVGSSGALCAAIYERYAVSKIDNTRDLDKDKLTRLKKILGNMESYFHGKSSGLDPLICYLNLPILIKSKTEMGTVGLPSENVEGEGAIFLLDSGAPGKTASMVNIFMDKLKNEGFRMFMKEQFAKHNDACIKAFLKGEVKNLFGSVKELSLLLLENFTPMIPSNILKIWKEGLDSNSYYLKLCGSGGGGYILGFTQNLSEAKEKLKEHNLEIIHKF
jgi:mevalonate kinase